MSLPAPWIDRIFEKLTLVYGSREFLSRWDGVPLADVKADWSHELAGYQDWPEAIKHALEHLPPDRAPTVLQFRDICRKAPGRSAPALPEPPANPARVQAEIAKLRASAPAGRPDPKDWARRILARHEAGEKINPASLRYANDALR